MTAIKATFTKFGFLCSESGYYIDLPYSLLGEAVRFTDELGPNSDKFFWSMIFKILILFIVVHVTIFLAADACLS